MKNIPGYIKRNHIKCLSDVRTSTILKYLTVKVSIQIYQATTMSTTSNLSLSNKFSLKQENIETIIYSTKPRRHLYSDSDFVTLSTKKPNL